MLPISSSPLGQLLDAVHGTVPDNPLRLFAVACVRRIWDRLEYPIDSQVVSEVERFALGFGKKLQWHGDGHFATTKLSIRPPQVLDANPDLKSAIEQQRHLHDSEPEILGVIRYDFYTPSVAARSTASFRFDFFRFAVTQSLFVEASPVEYWRPAYYKKFEDDSLWHTFTASFAEEWNDRTVSLIPEYCNLFEECVGHIG